MKPKKISAIDRFRDAMFVELQSSGQKPVVAILDKFTYAELQGEIMNYFGVTIKPGDVKKLSPMNYDGIQIFESHRDTPMIAFGVSESYHSPINDHSRVC